jgi:fibronectin-binding autotransporter adhesin
MNTKAWNGLFTGKIMNESLINVERRCVRCRLIAAFIGGLLSALSVAPAGAATNGWNQTAAGTYDYNAAGNWVGGVVNDTFDVSLTNAGAETLTFGANRMTLGDMLWRYAGAYDYTLRADGSANRVLTLGGNLSFAPTDASRTLTVGTNAANQGLNVDLGGATRSFYVSNVNQTITFINTLSNGSIVQSGAGTVNLGGVGTGGAAPTSDYAIPSYGTLKLGSGSTNTGATRVNSLTLGGASMFTDGTTVYTPGLKVYGNSSTNNTETIAGALTVAGYSSIAMTPNGAKNVSLVAGSLTQTVGGVLILSGTGLGSVATNAPAANTSNIRFGTAPTLVGGGGASGSQNMSIIPYARVGAGPYDFVTYTANGMRALAAGEYASTFANNDNATNNVKLGTDISGIDNTATINSLLLTASATISGTGTLTIVAGALDGMTFNNQLTLSVSNLFAPNGLYITSITPGNNKDMTINSAISGSGGLTVCPGYRGLMILGGSNNNTYAGTTTVNGLDYRDTDQLLKLKKPLGYTAIPGDLVVNGGSVYWYGDNQMSTNGSITVCRGQVLTGDGSLSFSQTIKNLTTLSTGKFDTGGGLQSGGCTQTVTGVMAMPGGTAKIGGLYRALNTFNANQLVMSGGNLTLMAAAQYGDNVMAIGAGGLTITNVVAGPYSPITIDNFEGRGPTKYGRLVLNGDVNVVANMNNANPVTFALAYTSTNGANPCTNPLQVIELNGTRTFTVGKGAGTADLEIQPWIQDNGGNAGALVKAGLGTLRLTSTNNNYTGGTTVNAGLLDVAGRLPGLVTVNSAGTLGGTGTVSGVTTNNGTLAPGTLGAIGTLTFASNLTFTAGATLQYDFNTSTQDCVVVQRKLTLPDALTINLNALDNTHPDTLVLFTYATISGSPAVSSWTLTGKGGYVARHDAGNNRIVAEYRRCGTCFMVQ